MSFYLARAGKKALLIDLDLGNSDVTNKLGYYCDTTIMDLLNGNRNVGQMVYTTPLGFDLIGGESGNFRLANLNAAQRKRFIRALREIGSDYDYVMYDLSAGINQTVIDFALAQDFQIVVTTPQDIIAGYSCIKAMFYRLQQLEKSMAERDPKYTMRTTLRPFIVLNQVPDFDTAKQLYEKLETVAKANIRGDKEFSLCMHFLGVVTRDPDRIREAELKHFLYSGEYGASRTGQCFNFLVKNLMQYRDPNEFTFTNRLKRFVDIFMRSVEETKYAE
jgi:MinD-like ATPase involved in chromosome partitioning or flagellar assembly